MPLLAAGPVAAVAWDRPWGLWTLALPVLLLLLSLRRERPSSVAVGTFALWRDAPAGAGGARRRHRFPPSRLALVAALAAGALALAGPRKSEPEVREVWRVVIDGGASLQLAHTDESGIPTGRGSRLDVALATLEEAREAADVEVEYWLDRGLGLEPIEGDPRASARRASPGRSARSDARAHDRPGVVLLTDRAPAEAPRRGGLVASGGGPVFGPIARRGDVRVVWDGTVLREEPAEAPPRFALEGNPPALLADLVALWADDRGLVEVGAAGMPCNLRLVFQGEGAPAAVRLARDGWSAAGTASPLPPAGAGLEPWLRADLGAGPVPVVTRGPGVVHVSIATLAEPSGEPAAFAVSWSELLDAAVAAPGDVVPLARRAAAGGAAFDPPDPAPALARAGPDWPWSARLALGAAGLVVLAMLLGEGRVSGRPLRSA